jgi:integrase
VIFLNWCGAVGYCKKKEWKIKTIRVKPKDREIGVLTVEQTKALLAELNPKYRTPMAIMLFAGLRPQGEMEKLKYEHITHGKWIDVPASKTPNSIIAMGVLYFGFNSASKAFVCSTVRTPISLSFGLTRIVLIFHSFFLQ